MSYREIVDETKALESIYERLTIPESDLIQHLLSTDDAIDDDPQDTSLDDLNLPTLKGLLDALLDTVGQVEHQQVLDNLSCAIFETFINQYDGLTEREQLSILLECANAIVAEYI